MGILCCSSGHKLTQGILMEKGFCQKPILSIAFTVRIPSQKIYITTIYNVRMMSERIAAVRVACKVRQTTNTR